MMVRETRFAFDDNLEESNPYPCEDFTEEDDRFLEMFSHPDDQEPSSHPIKPHSPRTNAHRQSEATKKHLADADWLAPTRPSRSRRKSA